MSWKLKLALILATAVFGAALSAISVGTGLAASRAAALAWMPAWGYGVLGAFGGAITAWRFTFDRPSKVSRAVILGCAVFVGGLSFLAASLGWYDAYVHGSVTTAGLVGALLFGVVATLTAWLADL